MNHELRLKIESYLAGTMPPEEAVAFEKQMENDPLLKKEVQFSMQINGHLSDDLAKTKVNKPSGSRRKYLLVATAAALFIVSTFALLFLNELGTSTLYAAYYSTSDLPSVIHRDASNTWLEKGVSAFQNRNYSEALSYFESYEVSDPETDTAVYLYKGATYLELNDFDKAVDEFEKAIDSNSTDATKGFWFKAMAYLKAKDEVRAKYILKDISEHVWYFNHDKAKALLKKL